MFKEHKGDEVLLELTGMASGTFLEYFRAVMKYVEANNLQKPGNRRRIVSNEAFARLTGTDEIGFGDVLPAVRRHLEAPSGRVRKTYTPDEVLLELTGLASGTLEEYVKGIWEYVEANTLHVPGNLRMIVPNETFARLMGTPGRAIDGFTMVRYIRGHLQR